MSPIQQQQNHNLLRTGQDHHIFHKLRKQKDFKFSIILLVRALIIDLPYGVCFM